MESGGRSRLLSFRNLLFRNLKPEFMAQNFKEASLKLRSQRLRNNNSLYLLRSHTFIADFLDGQNARSSLQIDKYFHHITLVSL